MQFTPITRNRLTVKVRGACVLASEPMAHPGQGVLGPRGRGLGRGGEEPPPAELAGHPACLGTFAPFTAKPATARLCQAEDLGLGPPGSPHRGQAESRLTVHAWGGPPRVSSLAPHVLCILASRRQNGNLYKLHGGDEKDRSQISGVIMRIPMPLVTFIPFILTSGLSDLRALEDAP